VRRPATSRRNTAQFKTRQRTAIADEFALALHDMHGQRRLAIAESGEFLRAAPTGIVELRGMIFLDQTTHRFKPQTIAESRRATASLRRPGRLPARRFACFAAPKRDDLVGDRDC
jgi:hypothetical protein